MDEYCGILTREEVRQRKWRPSEILEKVGWCQNLMVRESVNGKVTGYCMVGALIDGQVSMPKVRAKLARITKHSLSNLNDDPETTRQDCIRLLRSLESEATEGGP